MVNIDVNNFNESIRQAKRTLDKESERLKEVVSPFLSGSLNKKEVVEICNLGKFILNTNEPIKIISKNESPDFLVDYNGKIVGIELEAIFNRKFVQDVKSKQQLLENAANEFRQRFPSLNIFVNFEFKNDFLVRQSDKKDHIEKIVKYVYGLMTNSASNKPDFIESVHTMKHTRLNFSYNQGAYFVNHINDKLIEEAIQKKERKFDNYVENSKTEHQWLLIIIDSGTTESYATDEDTQLKKVSSKFERIYLVEDFSNQIARTK